MGWDVSNVRSSNLAAMDVLEEAGGGHRHQHDEI